MKAPEIYPRIDLSISPVSDMHPRLVKRGVSHEINALIAYATTDGHAETVANRIASIMRENGVVVHLEKITATTCKRKIAQYDVVIIGGSVHYGRHQNCLNYFVKNNRRRLSAHHSVFFSVSNTFAIEARENQARIYLDKFFRQTNWQPDVYTCVGGALKYCGYGPLKKWIMRRISEKSDLPTDTTRDHVLTDWSALESFFQDEIALLKTSAQRRVA